MKKYRCLRLIMLFIILLTLMSVDQLQPEEAAAQHGNLTTRCAFPDGSPYAGADAFIRYEADSNRVLLVDMTSGNVLAELESGVETNQFDARGWTQDCRYLIASLGPWGEQVAVAYDTYEGRRVGGVAVGGLSYRNYGRWLDRENYRLILYGLAGAFVWHLPSNSQTYLEGTVGNGYGSPLASASHDQEFGRLMARLSGDEVGYTVFDLGTGQRLAYLTAFDGLSPALLVSGPGDDEIGVRTFQPRPGGRYSHDQWITIYDHASLAPKYTLVFPTSKRYWPLVYSPNRSKVAARAGEFIYVFDVQQPVYHSSGAIAPASSWELPSRVCVRDMRWLDENTLESYCSLYRHKDGRFVISRWQLPDGERPFFEGYNGDEVCNDYSLLEPDDPLESVQWVCGHRVKWD